MLTPDTRIVTVADREGDLYDLYHEAFTKEAAHKREMTIQLNMVEPLTRLKNLEKL